MVQRTEQVKKIPAIIIARGGSQRVPNKNTKPFAGKTLTEWSIIQSQTSENVSLTVLSTDSDEIAAIGEKCGIIVLRRPVMPHNTSGAIVFSMAIDQLRAMGHKFEHFVSLLPTGPLRLPWDIDRGIEMYWKKAVPKKTIVVPGNRVPLAFAIPGRKTGNEPFYRSPTAGQYGGTLIYIQDNGLFSIHEVEMYKKLIQPIDDDAKAVRIARRLARRYHRYTYFYLCKAWQSYDIDYPDEFDLVEKLFQHYILDKGYYQ